MKQKILLFAGILTFLLFANDIFAQQKITGKVTTVSGEEIPGATVRVKGTTAGTITDLDGLYSVDAPAGSDILVFSFIGMKTQEIQITGTVINCLLEEDSEELEEVIVVGYGTMKKTDKTGAVSHVTAEDLNKGVLTDPIQALQGKAAGVVISKAGGDPNGGFSVKIRGSSSLTSGTDPLYVVDGVPGVDPSTISPDDIESFNILKDASSTAIYGTRGANGVIIITTKKGTSGENKVEFNNYVSVDQVAKRLDLLTADEFRAYANADTTLSFVDNGANTDWQDAIYRTGISQNYNLSFSGGNENTSYYSSVSHTNLEGVVIGTGKERSIGRVNVTQKALNDKLTVQTNIVGSIESNDYINYDGKGSRSVIYQAFQRNPTDPIYDENGDYFEFSRDFEYYNPVAIVNQITNFRDAKKMLGNLKADWEMFDGFTWGVNLGYTRDDQENFYAEPTYVLDTTTTGSANRSYSNYSERVLETTASYLKTLTGGHTLNAVAGYSYQYSYYDGFSAGGTEPTSNILIPYNIGVMNNVTSNNISSYYGESKLISLFGRVAYNFGSKYYLTASIRRDGSSKFGENNKWGFFPSVSGGWTISNESFFENIESISSLKLRAGYGVSGNQSFGDYNNILYYSPSGTTIDPETGEVTTAYNVATDANPDLKWEKTSEVNVGLDFGFLDNKISGSVEYYQKSTSQLIYRFQIPQSQSIIGYRWLNGSGTIVNKGLELNIQYYIANKKNFDWTTSFTFTKNKQEVTKFTTDLDNETPLFTGGVSGRGMTSVNSQIVASGYAIGTFWMPEFASISEDGQFLFYTESGGITRNWADAELREVGHAQPKFILGFSNSMTFFDCIDVNFAGRFVYKFDVLNVTNMIFGSAKWLPNLNVLQTAVDNETELGLNSSPMLSSFYLEDGTFVRIDNLSIGYSFNTENLTWITKARLYFSGTNLLTLTKYTGLDPEINYGNNLSYGLDQYNIYPKTKSYTFGVNLIF